MLELPPPRFLPCEHCGAPLPADEAEDHVCDEEALLDHAMLALRHEIAFFDASLARWLDTPEGRFERYYAARTGRAA